MWDWGKEALVHVLALFLEKHFHYSFTMIYQKKIGFKDFLKLHFKVI